MPRKNRGLKQYLREFAYTSAPIDCPCGDRVKMHSELDSATCSCGREYVCEPRETVVAVYTPYAETNAVEEVEVLAPRRVTVTREEGKPAYIRFEVEDRPIVEGYLYPVPVTATEEPVPVEHTERGFQVYGDPIVTSHGEQIRVYESSNAMGPRAWLGIHALGKTVTVEIDEAEARGVIARLQTWIDSIPLRWPR